MIISFEYIPLNGKIEDNDAEKDTIIDGDEKFQLIYCKNDESAVSRLRLL